MSETTDKIRIKQGCNIFGLSESYLRHAVMNRTIKSYKLGRATYISKSEIENLIEAGAVE